MPTIPAQLPDLSGGQPNALGLLRRLEGGAILTGRVQLPTSAGTTPVQVGNAVLQLLVSQSLQPGTLVQIRSEGGRILLEPQPGPLPGASGQPLAPTAAPSIPTPLASLIAANPALVQSLQLNQLPITLETLQILQTALGNVPAEQAPLLAFLLARAIPISAETLPLLRERLRTRGNLGSELSSLLGEVQNALAQGDLPRSEPLAQLLAQLQQLLSWDQTGDLADRIRQLKEFFATLEQKLSGGRPESAQSDLKTLLLKLDSLLQQSGLGADHALRSSAQKALSLLEGAQTFGSYAAPGGRLGVVGLLAYPVSGRSDSDDGGVGHARGPEPENPDRYDPKNLEILIQIDLSVLGSLRVQVRSLNEELKVTIIVSEKEHYATVEKGLPELVEALSEAGYESVETDVRVEAIVKDSLADRIDPLKGWKTELRGPGSSTLDIRL